MPQFRIIFSLLVAVYLSASQLPGYAEESATTSSATAGSTTTAGANPSSATLRGNVEAVEITLENLRDARLSTSRLRKATANLYDEVTRQEMMMSTNPNVVGSTVIMSPMPVFTGQYLPARKQWVDESMADIGPIIKLFKEDVDAAIERNRRTEANDKVTKAIDSIRDEVFDLVKISFEHYKQLETLTQGSSYDNMAIATATKNLDNDMKKLDKLLKKGISILQKEAKASKKA